MLKITNGLFSPSGAIAWNVAEESFMDDIPEVSQLKIRASYGVTGNQAIAEYRSLARLSTVHSVQGGQIVNAVRPSSVANNNLTWEKYCTNRYWFRFRFV